MALKSLLPWEIAEANRQKQPHCYVEREWMRLFLRDLGQKLEAQTGHTPVEMSFDGSALVAQVRDQKVFVQATGAEWDRAHLIPVARLLGCLPKRLTTTQVEVGVMKRHLRIANSFYEGTYVKDDWVYWMPIHEHTFVMPLHQLQTAGVIKMHRGQRLDRGLYFSLLADRIQEYAENTLDTSTMVNTFRTLEQSDLIEYRPNALEDVGQSFVLDNISLQERLALAGLIAEMPSVVDQNNPDAEDLYLNSDLEHWANAVTWS